MLILCLEALWAKLHVHLPPSSGFLKLLYGIGIAQMGAFYSLSPGKGLWHRFELAKFSRYNWKKPK
jgi:hypothetical protein